MTAEQKVVQNGNGYQALPSVWAQSDAALLERMIAFYAHHTPARILDATINRGRFWEGSSRPYLGLDIDIHCAPNVVGDNMAMPFAAGSFDIVVYDPPHVPDQGKDQVKDFRRRFGLGVDDRYLKSGDNLSDLFVPFLSEAYRVVKDDGLAFCKIADYVHCHRFQWAHVDLLLAARQTGWTACDCIIKVRPSSIISPNWKTAHHARRFHCYWIVLRKSSRCE